MDEGKAVEKQENVEDARIREQIANLSHLAITAHQKIISEIGGAAGIRDEAILNLAISSAFATFYGEDLHKTVFDKAAALMRSISLDHPFNDGNKRTSLVITAAFLFEHGFGFKDDLSDDEIVDFCIEIAKGKKRHVEISKWLQENCDGASVRSFKQVMESLQAGYA